ncbi:MAG: RNA polymerase factor sigma-54 [Gammaproteobacteria bacterium]|nr:RNA polymerase factor sigma-54 [Gammaproteobacteria bacterium]MDH5734988.1 RNA polymerase factor sigma-54 [Gammaproteobacteria bacterium]
MKQSLQLRIGQQLTMTPQLQQAIKLLQLSSLELQAEIQEVLESNPMLEIEDDSQSDSSVDNSQNQNTQSQESQNSELEASEPSDTGNLDINENQEIPEDLPVDSAWDDIYDMTTTSSGGTITDDDKAREFLENQSDDNNSLIDHLLWQLQVTNLSEADRAIATMIIDAIDDDGYLKENLEDIHTAILKDFEDIEMDEVEAVLHLVQHFDPVGVAARNLQECLLLQLEQFASTAELINAKEIITEHLDLLGNHDYAKLKRYTRMSEQELAAAISFIQTLNPKPGAGITTTSTQYVVPDVFVRKEKGRWLVELNPDTAPKLRVNPLYASFIDRSNRSEDNAYMKNNLQEAKWFLKSLLSRNETLMRVATAIVEHQRTFLEYGEEGMKPLVLREIAEELELHESTISRVTTQKYMHTPNGLFEFKYFFSSHVGTADGGECSATAIRAMIKKLIDNEDSRKPMSDNKLASLLVDQGINVARRTVAKYREAMMIAPSNERKRLS